MSSHHDDHHHSSDEKKPVAFTVPLIFALSVMFVIIMLVSIGDPSHGCECTETCSKECMEACEKGGHPIDGAEGHGVKGNHEAATAEVQESKDSMAVNTHKPEVADSAKTVPAEHSEAHH